MTCQRFLYKLLWKKLGIPLILGCGLIAMVTTFYHHTKFNLVEEPPNTQQDKRDVIFAKPFHAPQTKKKRDTNKKLNNHLYDVKDLEQQKIRYFNDTKAFVNIQDVLVKNIPYLNKRDKKTNVHPLQKNKTINTYQHGYSNHSKRHGTKLSPDQHQSQNEGTKFENGNSRNEGKEMDRAIKHFRNRFENIEKSQNNKNSDIENNKKKNRTIIINKAKNNTVLHNSFRINSTDIKNPPVNLKGHKKMNKKHAKTEVFGKVDHEAFIKLNKSNTIQIKVKHHLNMTGHNISQEKLYKHDTNTKDLNNIHLQNPPVNHLYKENMSGNNKTAVAFTTTRKPTLKNIDHIMEISIGEKMSDNMYRANESFSHKEPGDNLQRPIEFEEWEMTKQTFCYNRFHAYNNEFVHLINVILDRNSFQGKAGGEEIKDVLNQKEEEEFYRYELGCFQLPCESRPDYFFNGGFHLPDYLFNMKTKEINSTVDEARNGFYIAVTRYEYANIYHTMTDWYNAFLVMKFFNKTPSETNILIIDAHPKGNIDSTWGVIFNSSIRLHSLKPKTMFPDMAWGILGYDSPMLNHFLDSIPLIHQFHHHFLSSYKIKAKERLDCKKIKILFIWRRDYVAHPRNPTGKLSRKIKNEKELLKSVQRKFNDFYISGVQIDLFTLHKQLDMIAKTDVLIGMHGAGLTHAMFLPKHAGLIELVPNYWTAAMDHFMSIAQWRGLFYERWINSDPHNEVPNDYTRIPPEIINVMVKSTLRKMKCIKQLAQDDYDLYKTVPSAVGGI